MQCASRNHSILASIIPDNVENILIYMKPLSIFKQCAFVLKCNRTFY